MSRQDEKKLYEQQEEKILAQSDAFINLLTKRGILADQKIDSEKVRSAKQEKTRNSYHNTLMLLQQYRTIVWMMRRGDKAAAKDEKAGVLLQSLQGKVVDGTSGANQAESGL